MPRTIPKRRKCRVCMRNFDPRALVTEALEHDERGYPMPVARWCPTHAVERYEQLVAAGDPRDVDAIEHLRQAIVRFERSSGEILISGSG